MAKISLDFALDMCAVTQCLLFEVSTEIECLPNLWLSCFNPLGYHKPPRMDQKYLELRHDGKVFYD